MMNRELNHVESRYGAGSTKRPGVAEIAKYVVMAVILVYIVLLMILSLIHI